MKYPGMPTVEYEAAHFANIKTITFLQDEIATLRTKLATAREALGWFIADNRFQVAVGGNPNVVERMLADARKAYEDTAI